MSDKVQMVTKLGDKFNSWEELLASLSEEQIIARQLPSSLSIKDVVGHLRAWQQISIARLEAALHGGEPVFHGWPEGIEPDAHDNLERINAWIHVTYRDLPWAEVYRDWREGFRKFLELSDALPEEVMFEKGRYPWLGEYPLSAVLDGSLEHHREHLDELQAWLHHT